MASMAGAIKRNRKAAGSIQPITQSQNHATSYLYNYGLGGVHTHTCIHTYIPAMKVILRNQAHARPVAGARLI